MSRKLKILQIVASYKPSEYYGGPIISISALCELLVKNGHHVDVLTTTADGPRELNVQTKKTYQVEGANVKYFRRWTGDHSSFSPALLWELMKTKKDYDLIHIHSWWGTVPMLSAMILKSSNIRSVLSARGALSQYSFQHRKAGLKSFLHQVLGKTLLNSMFHHVTSEKEAKELKTIGVVGPIQTIPNLVVPPKQMKKSYVEKDNIEFCFLGRIDPVKNLEYTFDILSQLKSKWQLKIGGSGDQDYVNLLKEKAYELGITDHILWKGKIPMEERFQFLFESDCLLLFSHTENYSNVVAEAMSIGVAVIVTEGVGISKQVIKQNAGRVIGYEKGKATIQLNEFFNQTLWYDQLNLDSALDQNQSVLDQYVQMYNSTAQMKYARNATNKL